MPFSSPIRSRCRLIALTRYFAEHLAQTFGHSGKEALEQHF
jgi:hypothetical protein